MTKGIGWGGGKIYPYEVIVLLVGVPKGQVLVFLSCLRIGVALDIFILEHGGALGTPNFFPEFVVKFGSDRRFDALEASCRFMCALFRYRGSGKVGGALDLGTNSTLQLHVWIFYSNMWYEFELPRKPSDIHEGFIPGLHILSFYTH
jgi:hypothetical protein